MKILLEEGSGLNPDLPAGTQAVYFDPARPVPEEHRDAEALVIWSFRVGTLAQQLPRVRWVQSLSAGTEGLAEAGFAPDVVFTSGSGFHDRTVTEHALTLTLAAVRRVPEMLQAQAAHRWAHELGGPRPLHRPGELTTLLDSRVLIWGFGSIGQTLAPHLEALGAHVRGVARSAGDRGGFEVITEDDLATALPETDVLIMVLPSTPETRHVLDAGRLALLPRHAVLVNVGRGSTVDEEALVAALHEGHLTAAALDVTEIEPLPADSPLWDAPRTIISPHAAGGRAVGADDLITANLTALLAGEPLRNVVPR